MVAVTDWWLTKWAMEHDIEENGVQMDPHDHWIQSLAIAGTSYNPLKNVLAPFWNQKDFLPHYFYWEVFPQSLSPVIRNFFFDFQLSSAPSPSPTGTADLCSSEWGHIDKGQDDKSFLCPLYSSCGWKTVHHLSPVLNSLWNKTIDGNMQVELGRQKLWTCLSSEKEKATVWPEQFSE